MSLATVIERSRQDREGWKYTDLEKLLKDSSGAKLSVVKTPAVKAKESARLVFTDGVWQAEQSHMGNLPAGIMQGDASKGYRLVLEGQTCLVTSPVEMVFVTNAAEATVKLSIELGQSGRLTLIERHEGSGTQILESAIKLAAQAKLVHAKMISGAATHLSNTKITVAEGGYYDNFVLIKNTKLTRNEIEVKLEGKMSQCALNGAMLLRNREHADTTTRITHAATNGTSRQFYKSVVSDQARGVFQGKILVARDAQKTDGHQLSRALLLSDQAEMDTKPELEIYADDVKCSHGATVGDLDKDALFYLRARGLNEADARALLVEAFVGEIIDEIHIENWRETCRAEVEGWLHEQN